MSITIIGPSTLTLQPSDQQLTQAYGFQGGGSSPTWSVQVTNSGGLTENVDFFVTISSSGVLTVTLADGLQIDSATQIGLRITAIGQGNNRDTQDVTVQIPAGNVPCFVAGTLIEGADGPIAVEDLRVGQLVRTQTNGLAKVLWIGDRKFGAGDLEQCEWLRPICIRKSSFGPGQPSRDLFVSPQHRICLSGWRAELLFGEEKVLVPASFLVDEIKVFRVDDLQPVHYFHFIVDKHEIVFAEGLAAETLFPGDMALAGFETEKRRELCAFLDGVASDQEVSTAGRCLRKYEAKVLLEQPNLQTPATVTSL